MQVDKEMFGIVGFAGDNAEVKQPFSGKSVSMILTNTGSAAENRTIAIAPGWYGSAALIKDLDGNTVNAIVAEGTFDATTNKELTAAGVGCKVNDVVGMFKTTPCRIKGIKVKADAEAQLSQEIQFIELDPNGQRPISRVIPANFKSDKSQDAKLADIDLLDELVVMGPDGVMLIKLAAGRTITLTMFYENRASFRKQLEVMTKRGQI